MQDYLVQRFGGLSGLRDKSLFDAAMEQPKQTFNNIELYPTGAEKAARYAFGMLKNHPFVDGNKRIGTVCLDMFLEINGYRFKPRHDELLATMYSVADGSIGFEELVAWVRKQI